MSKKRILATILALVVAFSLFAGLGPLFNNTNQSYAREIFLDTETLVKEKVSAQKSFTILEVVGNLDSARIGYLIEGAEPVDLSTDATLRATLVSEGVVTENVADEDLYPIYYDTSTDTVKNNNFFKETVFGGISDADNLTITVITKTPENVAKSDVDGADLVYISGLNASDYSGHDFKSDVAKGLLQRITSIDSDNPVPCVIDYSVYLKAKDLHDNNTMANSNLYKVSAFLLGDNIENAYTDIALDYLSDISAETWQEVLNTMVIDNEGHFVRSNVYWYNHDSSDSDFVSSLSSVSYFASANIGSYITADATTLGFSDIYDAIEKENYNNQSNASGRPAIPTNAVSPALVVQYIINHEKDSGIIYKDKLNILEIEPCKEYSFDTTEEKVAFINKYLPDFVDKEAAVTITNMTMSEFVGHNEDITEEYDLIYIGSNIDYFNRLTRDFYITDAHTTFEQRTFKRYGDADMMGLVYSHVGDIGNVQYWGLIKTDSSYTSKTDYRQPGIDLTTYKYNELKTFLDNGYPIIVADDFFTYGGTYSVDPSHGAPSDWNAGHIVTSTVGDNIYGILDTSSYLYKLMVYAVTGQDTVIDPSEMTGKWAPGNWNFNNRSFKNLVYESGATPQGLLPYVNEQKLYLNLTSKPVEYTYTTTGTHNHINTSTYLQPASDGNYYLNYEFSISSLGKSANGTTYNCELFIDINNDGKYSKTQEKIDALYIKNLYTGEVMSATNGAFNLVAGVPYKLTRALPVDYLGCLSWELMVTSNLNSKIHDSRTGYTVMREPDQEKQVLNILQITSGDKTVSESGKSINNNVLNLEADMANKGSLWGELLNNIPDFELHIKTIPTYGPEGLVHRYNANNDFLNDYDMLIFGFSDGFADIRNEGLLKAIEKYANSGHCILFAHDNTFVQTSQLVDYYDYTTLNNEGGKQISYSNSENLFSDAESYWKAYEADERPRYLTQYIRKITGMDAYGVTTNGSPVRSGTVINKYTDATKKTLTSEWQYLLDQGKDIAFAPNSYQTKTVTNTQGATYIQLREWVVGGVSDWNGKNDNNMFFAYDLSKNNVFLGLHTQDAGYTGSDLYCSTLVEKVNDGMITNYPYKIPDLFYGANTHSQYWALDLETDSDKDGESDLVVWYTIADYSTSDNNSYKDDLSSLSPKDAKNNYYIYNMGNITYTGVGHTGGITEQEAKLFVNTMVASYVASIKNPKINIVEDGTSFADDIDSIVIPYFPASADDTKALEGEYERVYFRVADNNIAKGSKTIKASFYLDGVRKEVNVYLANGTKVYSAGSGTDANLTSGNSYYAELPVSWLVAAGTNDFRIDIYSDWIRSGTRVTSDVISDELKISKVELYDLD